MVVNHTYFLQIDNQSEGQYLYYYKETSKYKVSDELGDDACGLQCTDKSGHIVSHHWQYPGEDGQACDDADMRLVAVTNECYSLL